MKHKAWFFYLIIILIIINISSFLIFKYGDIDKRVKSKISEVLGKALNAKVSIEKLSLNDKQLNITKLKITTDSKSFYVCSKQIYVEYNIFLLLKSRFKNLRGISLIKIYEPKIKLNIKANKRKKNKKNFEIPDLRNWFKRLEVINANFDIEYKSKSINFKQKLKNINLKIKNKKESVINLEAKGSRSDSLYAKIILKKNILKKAKIQLSHYRPDSLQIKNFKRLKFDTDLSVIAQNKNMEMKGKLKDVAIKYGNWELKSDSLALNGNKKKITIAFSKLSTVDGFPIKGKLGIEDFFKKPKYQCDFSIRNIAVERYAYYVFGKANAGVKIRGALSKPDINITAFSKKLNVETETFSDVKASAAYKRGKFQFSINDLIWENNHLQAQGEITKNKGVVCSLAKRSLQLKRYGLELSADLSANMQYKNKFILNTDLENLSIRKNGKEISNLFAEGQIIKNSWFVNIGNNKSINLIAKGNFLKKNIDAGLKLKHLKLSRIFNNIVFPITSGNVDFKLNNGKILSGGEIIFYDQNFGKFDGEVKYRFRLDKKKNKSVLEFETKHARYNFEPFSIRIKGDGSADSIKTTTFSINNKINADATFKLRPKPDLNFKISGNNIDINEILRYFTDYQTINQYKGKINFALHYSSLKNKNIEGILTASSFTYKNIKNIDAYITFFGNKNFFTLDKMLFYQNSENFFAANGNILFKPFIRAKFVGKIQNLNLYNLISGRGNKGKINGYFTYDIKDKEKIFKGELKGEKLKLLNINIDSLNFAITQKNKFLNIEKCSVFTGNKDSLNIKGKLGYNIFSQNFYSLPTDTLELYFKGDLLKILKAKVPNIDTAHSQSVLDLGLSTDESGLTITKANLKIKKGLVKLKKQPVPIDKISVDMIVENNKLYLKKFKSRIGEGYLYIKNIFPKDKKYNFVFSNVNIGILLIKTSKSGILLNIPGYVAEGSFLNIKISGRDSDYLKVSGPFDDIKIKGDIIASNGNLVYPPNTDNLMKIIKNPISAKQRESEVVYPFSLDLMLKIGDNVHYTTYPINLLMTKGGYLNLLYKEGMFSIPDAFFVSEKGDLNIFGTVMKADYVSVKINKLVNGFKLNGEFYKDIPDGTRVTMLIYTENQNGKNKIKFKFMSDRSGDSTMDIISMLRYGKRIEEINPTERTTLLQDELVQIAGLSIENAFISPLFYPLENFIKHFLKLDYFNIKTGFVQNVFDKYYYRNSNDNNLEIATQGEKISKFGMDMFLNNLTLQFTKHIYKKTFLDYTVSFQKSTNLAIQSKLGIYHNISLKVEIPYKLRLSLDYKILPFDEKNSFQIGIEKSIKFY